MIAERPDSPDALDRAIDDVARQLVSVPQDRELASRIVASLPPRRSPWLAMSPRWAVHAVGAASLAAVAAMVWMGRGPAGSPASDTAAVRPIPAVAVTAAAPLRIAVADARVATRAVRAARVPPAPSDHERALAPVDGPGQIAVAALEGDSIAIAPAVLEPLTVDALVDGGAPPEPKEQ